MSRWIKESDFLVNLARKPRYSSKTIGEAIDEAPTIEIVRCKECKHGTYCEEADMYICNANDQDLYEAEHFCSYGEREGE